MSLTLILVLALQAVASQGSLLPDVYSCRARMTVPYANNIENFAIFYDKPNNREKLISYNSTGGPVLTTFINGHESYYVEMEKFNLVCLNLTTPDGPTIRSEPTPAELAHYLPDLEDSWVNIGQTRLHGRVVEHFRLLGTYPDSRPNRSFVGTREFQQDFYCHMNGMYCIPVKWEMHSTSLFHSHFDYYIMEYSDFSTAVKPEEFITPELCLHNSAERAPTDGHRTGFRAMISALLLSMHEPLRGSKSENQRPHSLYARHLETIARVNENPEFTFTASANRFAHMTPEEHTSMYSGFRSPTLLATGRYGTEATPTFVYTDDVDSLPSNIDWRIKGVVGMVKDQISCGSCWTFGAIGSIEGRINKLRLQHQEKRSEPLVSLSEQALVDCFWDSTSQGCRGGEPLDVINWVAGTMGGKVPTQASYPYLGANDYCKEDLFKDIGYRVTGATVIEPYSIASMKAALLDGPVSIGIAVTQSLLFYTGGVYNDPECGHKPDDIVHAVTLVGYGSDTELGPYWIVRNSWSPAWGMDGYIYISMKDNICGVLTAAAAALVE